VDDANRTLKRVAYDGRRLICGQDGDDADDLAGRVALIMLAALADAACSAATANSAELESWPVSVSTVMLTS
jgi:hypothetical protein